LTFISPDHDYYSRNLHLPNPYHNHRINYFSENSFRDPAFVNSGAEKFSFTLKPEFSEIPSLTNGPLDVNFLVKLKIGLDKEKFKRKQVDLVLVLDHSGSMAGSKLDLLKSSLLQFLDFLDPEDRISIIQFNQSAEVLLEMSPLRTHRNMAISKIKAIKAEGGTSTYNGIVKALNILEKRDYFSPVSSIFLLSDGVNTMGESPITNEVISRLHMQPFTIHTFGYGSDHDPELLASIANLKDGGFHFIENYNIASEHFVQALGGLVSVAAKEVRIIVGPTMFSSPVLQGCRIFNRYEDKRWSSEEFGHFSMKLTHVLAGTETDLILTLRIPAEKMTHRYEPGLVDARVEIDWLDGTTEWTQQRMNVVIDPSGSLSYDIEVMKHRYRVQAAQVLAEAGSVTHEGDFRTVKKKIQNLIQEMNLNLPNDEFVKGLLEDLRNALVYITPESYKYGGKHNLIGNSKAQYQQRTYLQSSNHYGNVIQDEMLSSVRQQRKP
jgi:hypothetical protein